MSDERYEGKTYIGSGGMATVYRAWDSLVGRDVALKEIAEELRGNEDVRDMFLNEARKMAQVKHRNVVQVYDVLYNDGIPTIVQEYMEAGSLAAKIGASTMSSDEVLKMLSDVTYGLRAIHAAGLIHRDMKPDNVLGDKGDWKVGDFGVAMSGDEEVLPFIGSKYAAPEVLNAPDTISVRSDIYSVGVMAMELLLGSERFEASAREALILVQGEPPGGRDTSAAFWQRWVSGSASLPPLNEIEPSISKNMAAFLTRLTAKNPEERPTDCDVVLAEIAKLREDESMRMGAPTAITNKIKPKKENTDQPQEKAKSPLWFKALIAVGLILLLGIGALFLMPTGDKQYTVALISDPPGASVSVNGQALPDSSPVSTVLKLGDVIAWEMPGFISKNLTMAKDTPGLVRDESNELSLTTELERLTLRVIVISKPDGTSLTINGQPATDDGAVYHEVATGDVLGIEKQGYKTSELTVAENMSELTLLDSGNYVLNVSLEREFFIGSSEMAQTYLLQEWRKVQSLPISRGDNNYDGNAFVIPIGTRVSFDLHPQASGTLSAIHLGSDNFLTLVYPNQDNESREVAAGERLNLGEELSVVASEPLGRDWMVFLVTEKPLTIPEIEGSGPIGDWARYYEFGPLNSPGEQLLTDIVNQSGNTILAMEIVPVDIVKAEE